MTYGLSMVDLKHLFRLSAIPGFDVKDVANVLRGDGPSFIAGIENMQIRNELFHEKQKKKQKELEERLLEAILRNIDAMTREAEHIISQAGTVIERLRTKAAKLRDWATRGAYDAINDIDNSKEEIARTIRLANQNHGKLDVDQRRKALHLIRSAGLHCDDSVSNDQVLKQLNDADSKYQEQIADIQARIPLALKQADGFDSAAGAASDTVETAKTMLNSIPENASPQERENRIKNALDYLKTNDDRLRLVKELDSETLQSQVMQLANKTPNAFPAPQVAVSSPSVGKKDIFRND